MLIALYQFFLDYAMSFWFIDSVFHVRKLFLNWHWKYVSFPFLNSLPPRCQWSLEHWNGVNTWCYLQDKKSPLNLVAQNDTHLLCDNCYWSGLSVPGLGPLLRLGTGSGSPGSPEASTGKGSASQLGGHWQRSASPGLLCWQPLFLAWWASPTGQFSSKHVSWEGSSEPL